MRTSRPDPDVLPYSAHLKLIMQLRYGTEPEWSIVGKKRRAQRQVINDARRRGTLQWQDEIPVNVIVPQRTLVHPQTGRRILWMPEEATNVYCRRSHLATGHDVARGDKGYWQNGRRQPGRRKFHWSLLEDIISGWDIVIHDSPSPSADVRATVTVRREPLLVPGVLRS